VLRSKKIEGTFRSTELKERGRSVSINIALLRSEKQSRRVVAGDIFMTEIRQPLHEDFAAKLHPLRSLVTRAAATCPKLASVEEE